MAEMGHTDPALAPSIYAQAMRRDEGENKRLEALGNGYEWAQFGAKEADDERAVTTWPKRIRSTSGERGARPAGFEPATSASGGQRSIH